MTTEKKRPTDKFLDDGLELFKLYCEGKSRPFMFPPAPSQNRIDIYEDFHIQTDKEAETDQKKQSDYEAEVVMYRALEQLDASMIVLHGLKYTHKQFRMWDSNHDAKSCSKETNKSPSCKNKELNKTEGEHDFVVIGPDYIVKIEVKNPKVFQPSAASNIMPKSPIRSSINNAKVQLKKAEELICGIAEKTSGQSFQKIELIQLVAFPNLDQTEISQGTDNSEVNLVLVNKSDLQNFKTFWKNNIEGQKKSKTSIDGDIGKIQSVLIQMFAIGTNNKIEEIEISPAIRKLKNKISLADCVVDIDRKLRDGRITFERENRSSKPNVSKISDTSDTKLDKLPAFLKTSNPADTALTDNDKKFFKDYLGLNYVTNEQWKAYQNQNEKENQEEDQEKLADKKEDGNDKLQHEAKQKEIETKKLDSQTRETEKLSHIPLYGHFIHGPQILVQVYRQDAIEYFHWDTIEKIFNLEIKDREIECAFFFFPRFFHRRGKREEWIRDNSDDLFTAGTEKRKEFISSSEFTQCHILLPFDPTTDYAEALQFLYNAISRARVLCHVHVLMNKSRDEVDGKLRVIFPEARIKYEEPEP
ncbi:uncharacterized protein LOC134838961 [Symsagittifera roscoffensis]|uniref:uncharacterized protein LOC134838961 n=1 Tax=Symsagittifera roscoffensis TaxID=84072 RepID=UPI00307C7E74